MRLTLTLLMAASLFGQAVDREPGLYATFEVVQGTDPKTQQALGKIVCKLYEKESPLTVQNFTQLARGMKMFTDPKTGQRVKRPLFNGLTFHRVIPGFMIQGGDPLGTGMGGTDVIKDEFDPSLQFDKAGVLAMANAGPNTGSSQFFITEGPTPHLNGRHTIFGQVIEGQNVVEAVARVPRGQSDKPNTPVIMKRVLIERFPKPVVPAKPKPAPAKPNPAAPKPAAPKPAAPKTTPAVKPPAAAAVK
jgi:peptidyl-prolyl cis-trans isomerase A (cyclophilin A)